MGLSRTSVLCALLHASVGTLLFAKLISIALCALVGSVGISIEDSLLAVTGDIVSALILFLTFGSLPDICDRFRFLYFFALFLNISTYVVILTLNTAYVCHIWIVGTVVQWRVLLSFTDVGAFLLNDREFIYPITVCIVVQLLLLAASFWRVARRSGRSKLAHTDAQLPLNISVDLLSPSTERTAVQPSATVFRARNSLWRLGTPLLLLLCISAAIHMAVLRPVASRAAVCRSISGSIVGCALHQLLERPVYSTRNVTHGDIRPCLTFRDVWLQEMRGVRCRVPYTSPALFDFVRRPLREFVPQYVTHGAALCNDSSVVHTRVRPAPDDHQKLSVEEVSDDTETGSGAGADSQPAQTNKKIRNVIIVMLESTRRDAFPGDFTGEAMKKFLIRSHNATEFSPLMMKLARESGLLLNNIRTTSAYTNKVMLSTFCSTYPHYTGGFAEAWWQLKTERCLPELLRDRGWNTSAILCTLADFAGYDVFLFRSGIQGGYDTSDMQARGMNSSERLTSWGYADGEYLGFLNDWFETMHQEQRPFFGLFETNAVHYPVTPTPHVQSSMVHYVTDKRFNNYLNIIRYQDEVVYQVIERFRKEGLLDETLFVFFGDHGDAMGEHGYQRSGMYYEEFYRIGAMFYSTNPAFVRRTGAPRVLNDSATVLDLMPTILDLLDDSGTMQQQFRRFFEGRSVLREPFNEMPYQFAHAVGLGAVTVVQPGQPYKLVDFGNNQIAFDLEQDAFEKHTIDGALRPITDERLVDWMSVATRASQLLREFVRQRFRYYDQ